MTERRLPGSLGSTGTSADADQNDIIQKGPNGLWFTRGAAELVIPGRFLTRTVYTSGTGATHNLNARTTKFRVYGQGPGGGASGADGQAPPCIGMGSPGASGAYFDHMFTVSGGVTSFTYSVGQGGAGGSGNVAGSPGTNATSVTYNGVTVGGNLGLGAAAGENAASRTSPTFIPALLSNGGSVIGSPDIGVAGQRGTAGFVFDNFSGTTGVGGISVMGLPGAPRIANTGGVAVLDGFAGTLGAGGSPGLVCADVSSVTGGAGGNGILIVEEYS